MTQGLDLRPAARSQIVELSTALRQTRRWGLAITIGSFLFGFDTGIISGALPDRDRAARLLPRQPRVRRLRQLACDVLDRRDSRRAARARDDAAPGVARVAVHARPRRRREGDDRLGHRARRPREGDRPLRRALALALAALQQFAGINAIIYYAPTIMHETGLSDPSSIFYSVFIGVINLAMTIVSIWLIDRLGRRVLLLASAGRPRPAAPRRPGPSRSREETM